MKKRPTYRPQWASDYRAALGRDLRRQRRWLDLSQLDVADRMVAAGFITWSRSTQSDVERAVRGVGVDELVGLARVLDVDLRALLPEGVAEWHG